ncbi:MAG TPA: TetR/AcrR family transcriptional regulator [Rhizomicrobium sp.]
MPYPASHRAARREKIVSSARRLFNRCGFDNVSIGDIMAGAGLTHGGFYKYFRSKSDLYTEVMNCFFTDPKWKNCWKGIDIDLAGELGPQIVRAYLSTTHFEDVENSCPMVALPTDVARNGEGPKLAFQAAFDGMVELLSRGTNEKKASRAKAHAIAALCIGGMVAARAIADRNRADKLREHCMAIALDLGGWKAQKNTSRLAQAASTGPNISQPPKHRAN